MLDHLQAELEYLPPIPLVVNGNKPYMVMPQKLLSFLFEGSLGSRVVCDGCSHVSTREEPFQDLSLDFPLQWVGHLRAGHQGVGHERAGHQGVGHERARPRGWGMRGRGTRGWGMRGRGTRGWGMRGRGPGGGA